MSEPTPHEAWRQKRIAEADQTPPATADPSVTTTANATPQLAEADGKTAVNGKN